MGSTVAAIGIAGIITGRRGAIVGVESGIGAGRGIHGIIRVAIAPVIPQIPHHSVRIDHRLGGRGLRSSDLGAGFVVGAVQTVTGGESGGPAADILHRFGPGLDPRAAQQIRPRHGSFIGLHHGIVPVAVLLLGLDEALVHIRLGLLPGGHDRLIIFLIAVAAAATDIGGMGEVHTAGANGSLLIAMTGS